MDDESRADYLQIALSVALWFVPWANIPPAPRAVLLLGAAVFLAWRLSDSIRTLPAILQDDADDVFSFTDPHDIALVFGVLGALWVVWVLVRGV